MKYENGVHQVEGAPKAALLFNLAKQELIDRYAGSLLGGVWTFIMPLIQILIFMTVFSKLMGARLGGVDPALARYGYGIYLVSGILPWNSFSATLLRVCGVFREKAHLAGKVRISLLHLPTFVLLAEGAVFALSLGIFLLILLILGFPVTWHWLWIPLIFLVQQLLAYALAFIGATLNVFLPDIKEMFNVLVQVWFWFTPIVYVPDILPNQIRDLLCFNPAAAIVQAYHQVIVWHRPPNWEALAAWALVGGALMWFGIWMFRRLERDLRDFL